MKNTIMRHTCKNILFITGAAALSACSQHQQQDERPNILLILADDMGYSDLGCYGSGIETPNLDSLAYSGLRFTQFYNAARSCPTRASLLTGLYPHQVGMGKMVSYNPTEQAPGPYQGYLNENCVTIAEVLKKAGYNTLMSGKWHVGESKPFWPLDRGFECYFGLISGASNYFDITKTKREGIKRRMALDHQPYYPPDSFYMTDAITDHAVKFLEQYADSTRPFFMYLAYTAPHWPLHAWPEDIAKYQGRFMKGWDALRKERHERMKNLGILTPGHRLSPRDEGIPEWESLSQEKKKEMDLKMAIYAAQIDRMDHGIGKVLKSLQESGKAKNTLVLFLSDNGACAETGVFGKDWRKNGLPPGGEDSYMSYGRAWANASNTPYRYYKQWCHEGGIRTPFILHWPGKIDKSGGFARTPAHINDIMATCAALGEAGYPDNINNKFIIELEGHVLPSLLQDGSAFVEHEILAWEHFGNRAVRAGSWKLVAEDGKDWELYNILKDPVELNNLVEKYPAKADSLKKIYGEWAAKVGI